MHTRIHPHTYTQALAHTNIIRAYNIDNLQPNWTDNKQELAAEVDSGSWGAENLAGLLFWSNKYSEVRFERVHRGVRKGAETNSGVWEIWGCEYQEAEPRGWVWNWRQSQRLGGATQVIDLWQAAFMLYWILYGIGSHWKDWNRGIFSVVRAIFQDEASSSTQFWMRRRLWTAVDGLLQRGELWSVFIRLWNCFIVTSM